MKMPPLLADFTHARPCKPFCEKYLTLPFGKAAENVIVTPEHFMLVAIVGGILLVAAVLVSSISTMRLKPKQILSQME